MSCPRVLLVLLVAVGCATPEPAPEAGIEETPFGTLPDGRTATLYTLTSPSGMQMQVTNYGGIITTLTAPDRDGRFDDVVLGYDTLDDYLAETPYFGALIGRYGNRIAQGRFTLDGVTYELATNNDANHLHGGDIGFDKVLWDATPFTTDEAQGLILTYTSSDGEEGYPGTLEVTVTYMLLPDRRLRITYEATTDQATPVNLTQHSYFNLGGPASDTILSHELAIAAEHFTPIDAGLIPTGERRPVDGTPFDFRTSTPIGARIDGDDPQLAYGLGYDHNFVLTDSSTTMKFAARLYDPSSGRVMTVHTTKPGLQFYSGNFLDGSLTGKGGNVYEYRSGLCLETQHFPDSPNQPSFPSTILRPGERYTSQTIYAFATDAE